MPADERRHDRTEVDLTIRELPKKDPWPLYDGTKYSATLRQLAVKAFLPYLSTPDVAWIRKQGALPHSQRSQQRYEQGYTKARTEIYRQIKASRLFKKRKAGVPEAQHQKIEDDIWVELEELVTDEWAAEQGEQKGYPDRENVRRMTARCIVQYCCNGHYLDEKPSHAGEKLATQLETLAALRDMMVAGWQGRDGRRHMFASIEDFARRDAARRTEHGKVQGEVLSKQSYADLKRELGVQDERTVWSKLTAVYPGIRKVKQRTRKFRKNKAEVMSAAKQVLGREAMTFAPWHKHPICVAACREAGIFDADKQFFWHPDNANETISIDALTVDPSKLVEGLEGIWDTAEKTLEQPILETRLHNTRPGEAPDVQAWLVVSAEFGAMVFFPRLGTKGGPEGAHDGCEWWYSQLTPAQLQLLKDMKYYNRDKALEANKEVAAKIQKQVEAGQAAGVDPTLFLTVEGKLAQTITSSEAAAMLDLVIIPTLRERIIQTGDFEQQCRDFAPKVGLQPHEWARVHFPRFLSIDNAPIHYYWRKVCLQPRISDDALNALVRVEYQNSFDGAQLPSDYDVFRSRKPPPPQGPDTTYVQRVAHDLAHETRPAKLPRTAEPYVPPEPTLQQQADALLRQQMEQNFKAWRDKYNGSNWEHEALHRLSLRHDGILSLLPQQFMPLPQCTPDMHCPVEHMVQTVKLLVRKQLLDVVYDETSDDVDVFSAKLYQGFIKAAASEYGNNEKGRRHVARSWEKQKCICQILSTPVGETVTVHYVFEDGGENASGKKKTEHEMPGTGGGLIHNARFT